MMNAIQTEGEKDQELRNSGNEVMNECNICFLALHG